MVDVDRLKNSWARVLAHGDQVPLRFYSRLFVMHPETRALFPLSMAAQRDRLVAALGHTVSHVDDLEALTPFLQELGRDHRKFGTVAEHYSPVGDALLATLADFLGEDWTTDLAQDWADAYNLVAKVMIEAAEAVQDTPAWWVAEVVAHERRSFDIAVLTIRPDPAFYFEPGQSMPLETELRPRLWRYYSPANAPRADGTIDLHVRRVPGGQLSSALVDVVHKGDLLRLGPPIGDRLTLPAQTKSDMLFIAGGTGLAPLKSLLDAQGERANGTNHVPRVTLFFGARTSRELYDLEALGWLERRCRWLTVVPCVADDILHPHENGPVVEVALRHGPWDDHDIYLCGSNEMVVTSVRRLREAGHPAARIYFEGFQGLDGEAYGVIDPVESDI